MLSLWCIYKYDDAEKRWVAKIYNQGIAKALQLQQNKEQRKKNNNLAFKKIEKKEEKNENWIERRKKTMITL